MVIIFGQVAEWFKAHAWRACGQQNCLVGSNPTLSACSGAKMGAVFLFGAWLSQVERCVRDAEVPGSNPGAPTEEVPSLFTFLGINAPAEAHRALSERRCPGALAEWYCTRLESERPKGLGGSNPSRSVFNETTLPVRMSREVFLTLIFR